MILDVYLFGALRVLVVQATGQIASVQDRISGLAANLAGFSPDYIARAMQFATNAHESQFSEA